MEMIFLLNKDIAANDRYYYLFILSTMKKEET